MKKAFFLFVLGCFYLASASAQSLVVKKTDGTSDSYSLQNVRRIVFADSEVRLASPEGRLVNTYSHADLISMNLDGLLTGIVTPTWNDTHTVAHYNTTKTLFALVSATDSNIRNYTYYIYNISGALVSKKKNTSSNTLSDGTVETSVDISDLIPGAYTVNFMVNSKDTFSFKFIK